MFVKNFALAAGSAAALVSQPKQARRTGALQAGRVMRETPAGELGYVELTTDAGSSAKVYPYGADVCSFKDSTGTEWIAVRPDAKLDGSKPISGGLSHCFPQFGPGEIQQHGFARNVDWKIAGWDEGKDSASVTFKLTPTEYTMAMWDKPFEAEFEVTLNADSLDTRMSVTNTGTGAESSFDFQAALHSYFDISSIDNLTISGSFNGKPFLNKMLDPPATVTETRSEITIDEEYDRVYSGVNDPVLVDPVKGKKLAVVNKQGWKDTVLWNPYGNEGMGYEKFVCAESVAYEPVTLAAGESWVGEMSLVPSAL